ncbi:MAG TPA: 4-alpha-glucanotransferase [Stellaceae bacterium]|nr:4-alpha-glucanotransferase [Stellaceae bacterium]
MTDRAAIEHVARLVGIEARHRDGLGRPREVSDDTLIALIEASGLPADPARAERALAEEEQEAPLGLSPVHVVPADASRQALALRLPVGCREILWSCLLESGEQRSGRVSEVEGRRYQMQLPDGLPLGYHLLDLYAGGLTARLSLIVAPERCHLPAELGPGARKWGLSCQLYGLCNGANWGIGDFSDLGQLARAAGSCTAAALGINPLHALFAAEPLHISPYSPSHRSWLNYLYIDVTVVPGFADDETVRALTGGEWFAATQAAARSSAVIDYGAVAACKRPVLEALFRRFRISEFGADGAARGRRGEAFREFQRRGGQALADFAVFEALDERYRADSRATGWRGWPRTMQDPRSPEVADFADAHRDRVEFFEFLQWEADRQLAAASAAGRDGGLAIGIYRDLAVGADPNGAEAWADQDLVATGASIGAPPDEFNQTGQNWGLAPVNPLALRRRCFAPFVAAIRANMRHAGILRIDHVMSLDRLYWVPVGMEATEGAYVTYPFGDLLRIVALESCRQQCAVVGEDLGTVPEGFRERMRSANLLSCRVLTFERRSDGGFVPPAQYPALAAASAATHDLPTLRGFWLGTDIDWRRSLDLYPDAVAAEADAAKRRHDRNLLLQALVAEGLLAPDRLGEFLSDSGTPTYTRELGDAILSYLARSRARLMLFQLEDVVGESEQANLPGTTDGHPNWRRRLSLDLDEIIDGTRLSQVAALATEGRLRAARG